jgi:hypothetical protein
MQATKFMNKLNLEKLINITKEIENLINLPVLNKYQISKLEAINSNFTELLITTEHKCKMSTNHWSDTLQHARLINKYWRIQIKGKVNNIKVIKILNEIQSNLPDVQKIWQGDVRRSPKCQLRRSINKVKKIKNEWWEHRKNFLFKLHHRYKEMGEEKKSKAIIKIRNAEFRLRCQRVCKTINKPRGESGGLTHLLIESEAGEQIIDNNEEIEK